MMGVLGTSYQLGSAVTIFGADGSRTEVALADKRHIAKAVIDAVLRVRSGEAAGASVH